MQKGWMYLVAILDWYSRYVLSWELDLTLEMPFVLSTVKLALAQAVPIICNSDQGSHFTSPHYCQLLRAANVQISMDGKGRALDNILRRGCGDPSNMKKFICMSILHQKRHDRNCRDISSFIITSGFIKHWSTKPQLKCIFKNGRKTRIEAMSVDEGIGGK